MTKFTPFALNQMGDSRRPVSYEQGHGAVYPRGSPKAVPSDIMSCFQLQHSDGKVKIWHKEHKSMAGGVRIYSAADHVLVFISLVFPSSNGYFRKNIKDHKPMIM